LLVSDASCQEGEHAVSGGFVIQQVNYAAVTEHWSLPTPFEEDAVPTGWQVAFNDGNPDKQVTAYVLCVPD
jgi:hypothetical protein